MAGNQVTKWVALVAMVLTVPCVTFALLCGGFLPLGVMTLLATC